MIAVIFELEPNKETAPRYFELAAGLRSELEDVDGFLSVERFESLARPGRYLSLSFWRDEESVQRWRCHAQHRSAQQEGRSAVLAGYRLRVASDIRDNGLLERDEAPADSRSVLE